MRLRMKIGTMSAGYYKVHGNYYARRKNARKAPVLTKPPKIGDRISWQEVENGAWCTGIVDDHKPEIDLYYVARH